MMCGNLMPGTKMPQPQMFVVPEKLCRGLAMKMTTTNLELKAFVPQGTKAQVLYCDGAIITSLGKA
jgi:hypothetical protein